MYNFFLKCLNLRLVHGASVARLFVNDFDHVQLNELVNLRQLYVVDYLQDIDSDLLDKLRRLKRVYVEYAHQAAEFVATTNSQSNLIGNLSPV